MTLNLSLQSFATFGIITSGWRPIRLPSHNKLFNIILTTKVTISFIDLLVERSEWREIVVRGQRILFLWSIFKRARQLLRGCAAAGYYFRPGKGGFLCWAKHVI